MSHFAVLVVGDDVESQLAPYHEFECDGIHDEYVQTVSNLDHLKMCYDSYCEHNKDEKKMSFEEYVQENHSEDRIQQGETTDSSRYYVVDEKGEIVDAIYHTNPNAQWDWYEIGGRYSDRYIDKNGEHIVEGLKKDFGFDLLRKRRADEAAKRYDEIHQLLNGKTWEPWDVVRARFEKAENPDEDSIEKAGLFYREQESVRAIKKHLCFCYNEDIDRFLMNREDYIAYFRNRAIVPYAFVKDGKWYAQGEMGWWGIDRKTCTDDEWRTQFNDMLDAQPDDTLLTVVDCHI